MTSAYGDPSRLDGNAAAGVLREVFAVEMTTASCTCDGCGRVSAVGGLLLYGGAMGSVLRCPSCEGLILSITSGPVGYFIELRGVIHVPPPVGN
jgi:Family of unknown function (DUF6510)